jgi:hypothetical protein
MVAHLQHGTVRLGDIFREIDEELRHDKAAELWKKYGNYVAAAAVLIVLIVAGLSWWQQHQLNRQVTLGNRFAAAEALVRDNKPGDAAAQFGALAQDASAGYATLARMYEAGIKAQSGDVRGAIATYDQIAGDSSVDRPFRDAATVLGATHALDLPDADLAGLNARLEPLVAQHSPYRHSAMELLALVAQKRGDNAKAKEYLTRVADDLEAPQGVRSRAAQLLALVAE